MDQSVIVIIGSIVAIVLAILVLLFALYGFQRSLKDTNRRRREGPANEYRRAELPDITARSTSSGKIEFGEIIELGSSPEPSFTTVPDSDLGKCAVCRNHFSDSNHILCPKCEATYHEHCFVEYDRTCINCGWRQL
jgi:hypothetical protein